VRGGGIPTDAFSKLWPLCRDELRPAQRVGIDEPCVIQEGRP
jgi:hypothetical protein